MSEKISLDVWKTSKVIGWVIAILTLVWWVVFSYSSTINRIEALEEHNKSVSHLNKEEVREIIEWSIQKEFVNFENRIIIKLDDRYQKKNGN